MRVGSTINGDKVVVFFMGKISNRECGADPIGKLSGYRQSDNTVYPD